MALRREKWFALAAYLLLAWGGASPHPPESEKNQPPPTGNL